MTPERWSKIESLWDRAAVLRGDDREAFIAAVDDPEVRDDLRALLEHADTTGFLARPVVANDEDGPNDPRLGSVCGAWRLLERVGAGGMGLVYRAERVDEAFAKEAAVKLLAGWPGPAQIRRFEAERQILADIEHPHIARLLDGGTAEDGTPYVVMEFVRGRPITDFCAEQRLDVPSRLRLFRDLCGAVDEAHRHLVVHRDVKPSNVLVTDDGEVKLLDFGIAKLLEADGDGAAPATRGGGLTPGYASPEQVAGEPVTIASDVYSLGVVFWEMLTGARASAHRREPVTDRHGALRTLPPPSQVVLTSETGQLGMRPAAASKRYRGDLDTVVAKATRRAAVDRYRTAAALADDVGRVLSGHPITAKPVTAGRRLTKLVRRHPVAASLVMLFASATIVLGLWSAILARRAVHERDVAIEQRARAEGVARFLEETFKASDPNAGVGEGIQARALVDRETARVKRELADEPVLQARFLNTLAVVYQNLGLFEEARQSFDEALRLRLAADADPLERAETESDLAWLLVQEGNYPEAMALVESASSIQEEADATETVAHAETLERKGLVYLGQGQFAEAEAAHRQALALRRALLGERHPALGESLSNLAEAVGYQGRPEEALDLVRQSIEIHDAQPGAGTVAKASALFVRGDQHFALRRTSAAVDDYSSSLEIFRARVSSDHPSIGILLNNRARGYRRLGFLDRAEADYRLALETISISLGEDHREVATVRNNLSHSLRDQGKFDEAHLQSSLALGHVERLFGHGHYVVGLIRSSIGSVLREWGFLEASVVEYEKSVEILAGHFGDAHPRVADILLGLARVHLELGTLEVAEETLARVNTILGSADLAQGPAKAEVLGLRGELALARNDFDGAVRWLRQALEVAVESPDGEVESLPFDRRLVEALLASDDTARAVEAADAGWDRAARHFASDHWQVAWAFTAAAAARALAGDSRDQVGDVVAALATVRQNRGLEHRASLDAAAWTARFLDAVGDPRAASVRAEWRRLVTTRGERRAGRPEAPPASADL